MPGPEASTEQNRLLVQLSALAQPPLRPIDSDNWGRAVSELNQLRPLPLAPNQRLIRYGRHHATPVDLAVITLRQLGVDASGLREHVSISAEEVANRTQSDAELPVLVHPAQALPANAALVQGFGALKIAVAEFHGSIYDVEIEQAFAIGRFCVEAAMTALANDLPAAS